MFYSMNLNFSFSLFSFSSFSLSYNSSEKVWKCSARSPNLTPLVRVARVACFHSFRAGPGGPYEGLVDGCFFGESSKPFMKSLPPYLSSAISSLNWGRSSMCLKFLKPLLSDPLNSLYKPRLFLILYLTRSLSVKNIFFFSQYSYIELSFKLEESYCVAKPFLVHSPFIIYEMSAWAPSTPCVVFSGDMESAFLSMANTDWWSGPPGLTEFFDVEG